MRRASPVDADLRDPVRPSPKGLRALLVWSSVGVCGAGAGLGRVRELLEGSAEMDRISLADASQNVPLSRLRRRLYVQKMHCQRAGVPYDERCGCCRPICGSSIWNRTGNRSRPRPAARQSIAPILGRPVTDGLMRGPAAAPGLCLRRSSSSRSAKAMTALHDEQHRLLLLTPSAGRRLEQGLAKPTAAFYRRPSSATILMSARAAPGRADRILLACT